MIIELTDMFGIIKTRDIAITLEQLDRFERGELIHNVFPDLIGDDRQFLLQLLLNVKSNESKEGANLN